MEEGEEVKAGQVIVKIPRVLRKIERYHGWFATCNRIV